MAQLRYNFWGPVLILDHDEVEKAVKIAGAGGDAVAKFAVMFPPAAPVAAVVVPYLAAEAVLMKTVDKGNGVYLTMLWATPGLVIPTTRPSGPNGIGLPPDWIAQGAGEFRTEDAADRLSWEIQPNAVDPKTVEFRLQSDTPGMWRKVLVMRDGLGSQWDIPIDPSNGIHVASNTLWADQVHHGQVLSLWKAKQFRLMFWVLDIGHLDDLQPGARAVFTWQTG